jgi:hypothetical protein
VQAHMSDSEDSISTEHRQDTSYTDVVKAFKVSKAELDHLLARRPRK